MHRTNANYDYSYPSRYSSNSTSGHGYNFGNVSSASDNLTNNFTADDDFYSSDSNKYYNNFKDIDEIESNQSVAMQPLSISKHSQSPFLAENPLQRTATSSSVAIKNKGVSGPTGPAGSEVARVREWLDREVNYLPIFTL